MNTFVEGKSGQGGQGDGHGAERAGEINKEERKTEDNDELTYTDTQAQHGVLGDLFDIC